MAATACKILRHIYSSCCFESHSTSQHKLIFPSVHLSNFKIQNVKRSTERLYFSIKYVWLACAEYAQNPGCFSVTYSTCTNWVVDFQNLELVNARLPLGVWKSQPIYRVCQCWAAQLCACTGSDFQIHLSLLKSVDWAIGTMAHWKLPAMPDVCALGGAQQTTRF